MYIRRMASIALCVLTLAVVVRAEDWPQWRGPERNGVSKETGLLKQWPKSGPELLWKRTDIGGGYSTPAVIGDRIYLMADRKGEEFTLAISVQDASEIWATPVGKVGPNQGPQYPGPRSTPTVEGDRLYVLGSDGDLACLETVSGKKVWSKKLRAQFHGTPGFWAYSESVLIDGDTLVCTPGGAAATMVALNKKDGELIWKCAVPGGDAAAYSSPMVATVGSDRQYVQFVANGVIGVDAKTGKFLWRYAKTKDQAANIPTPVVHEDTVFTSTSRNGSGLNRILVQDGTVSTKEVYYNRVPLNSIGGVVLIDGYLYGTDAKGDLVCMDFKTGEVKWRHACVDNAAITYADGMLYVRGQGGSGFGPEKTPSVALVEATPEGYHEKGRFEQPDHGKMPAWPHPVVANGRLYLRDLGVLLCYNVKADKPSNP
jgi:outer membrane protein assembly factor BamB